MVAEKVVHDEAEVHFKMEINPYKGAEPYLQYAVEKPVCCVVQRPVTLTWCSSVQQELNKRTLWVNYVPVSKCYNAECPTIECV